MQDRPEATSVLCRRKTKLGWVEDVARYLYCSTPAVPGPVRLSKEAKEISIMELQPNIYTLRSASPRSRLLDGHLSDCSV